MPVTRFVPPPFTRLVVAGALFHAVALVVFVLAAAGAFAAPAGGYAAVTATGAAGVVLHVALLLVNLLVRADHAMRSAAARHALAFDQWYTIVSLAGCAVATAAAAGLWIASAAQGAMLAGLAGLALVSGPALTVLAHPRTAARDPDDALEAGLAQPAAPAHNAFQRQQVPAAFQLLSQQ